MMTPTRLKALAVAFLLGSAAAACGSTGETIVSSAPGSAPAEQRETVPAAETPQNTVTTVANLGPDVGGPTAEDAAKNPAPTPMQYPNGNEGVDGLDVRQLEKEAVNLLVARRAVRRLPDDAKQRADHAQQVLDELDGKADAKSRVVSAEASDREGLLPSGVEADTPLLSFMEATSAPAAREQNLADLRVQMETALTDDQFSGFANNDFVLEKAVGVSVKGDEATVSVLGHERFLSNPNSMVSDLGTWQDDGAAQFDIHLVKGPDGTWQLLRVDRWLLQSGL